MANESTGKPYRLLALGRLPAATRDAVGDTLGSFSGMAFEHKSWRGAPGGHDGVLLTLPDRGFNVPSEGIFSNYPTRVQRIGFALRGATLNLTPLGTRLMRDAHGALMTGLDPGEGIGKQLGERVASPKKGRGEGRISVDSEGLAMADDGRLFISDEFAANIYCFSREGDLLHIIAPPDAFVPRAEGRVCFSSADGTKVTRGRAPNDGLEGLSITPDGRELYALLQSPLVQDRDGPRESRRYTRLLAFDISRGALPKKPKAHYVLELPLYHERGNDEVEPAEVNALVALGRGRILVLARESFGFGAKSRNSNKRIVFKQIMIGSLDGASNLAGSKYERKAKSVAPRGKLDGDIVPVRLEPFVDIADEAELNRVGLTARKGARGLQLISAKWESMALSPPPDPKHPRERLLFVGNDNDFRTRRGFMPDGKYDDGDEHDNLILVYRVTLPA
jgi:hypothetical protein